MTDLPSDPPAEDPAFPPAIPPGDEDLEQDDFDEDDSGHINGNATGALGRVKADAEMGVVIDAADLSEEPLDGG